MQKKSKAQKDKYEEDSNSGKEPQPQDERKVHVRRIGSGAMGLGGYEIRTREKTRI